MEFDRIIAPLALQDFLTKHWEKSYLHLKGGAGRFAALFDWDDLNNILENHRLAPEHVKVVRDGNMLASDGYFRTSPGAGNIARLESGRLMALLAGGASLLLENVAELSPRVRALSYEVTQALKCRNGVNLYAGWHTQKGFDLHWDGHGVMVLQVAGAKRWQIYQPTRDYPIEGDTPPKPTGPPALDVLLEDGDVLYLPRGWWHVAHPVNKPSLHLTLGLVPMHGLDLLYWLADRLRGQALVRQELPVLQDGAAQAAHIAGLRALVTEALDDHAIADFFRHAWEPVRGRPPLRLLQAPYDQLGPIRDDSRIRLASADFLSFAPRGEKVDFTAYGKTYSVPAYVVPALVRLRDSHALTVAELCTGLQGAEAAINLKQGLTILAQAGVVLVENDPERS